jgi:hypothetical protein
MNRMHRIAVITTMALTLAGGITSPAQAAAPSNDGPGRAKAATGIGYSDSVDVSQATSGALDPTTCGNNASVWYKYSPLTTRTINVNTSGSDYDTVIGVYTGSPTALTKVRCVNWGFTRHAALDLRVQAGTSYYFMVGVCCGTGRDGREYGRQLHLKFHLMAPLRIAELSAADTGVVSRTDGEARVTVSRRCAPTARSGFVRASLRQRVGETFVARGFKFRRATCGATASDIVLGLKPEGDIAFGAGPATATVRWQACSPLTGTCARRSITKQVVLAFPQA